MYRSNGKVYIGGYVVTDALYAMFKALGVKATESAIAKLHGLDDSPIYKKAIGKAPEGLVLALKSEKAVAKALADFTPTADSSVAFLDWQSAQAKADQELAQIDALRAQIEVLAASVPDGTTVKFSVATDSTKLAGEAYTAWANAMSAQFRAHVKADIADAEVLEYVLNNSKLILDQESGGLSAEVRKPGTRSSGTRKASGSGNRRSFEVPTSIAGVSWTGSWKSMASQLLALEVVKEGNFTRHASLGRAASAMPDKSFQFGSDEYTGRYITKHLEEFQVR